MAVRASNRNAWHLLMFRSHDPVIAPCDRRRFLFNVYSFAVQCDRAQRSHCLSKMNLSPEKNWYVVPEQFEIPLPVLAVWNVPKNIKVIRWCLP